MNKSENINELASALSKFLGDVTDVKKDKIAKGLKFDYYYAELSSILEIARPILNKYQLSVSQLCNSQNDNIGIETVLMHSSGQWISSIIEMPIPFDKPNVVQAIGALISYLRRYALAAILGIAQIDNDANQEEEPVRKIAKNYNDLLTKISTDKINLETQKKWLDHYKVKSLEELGQEQIAIILDTLKKREAANV